jgi:hypothetical protein
LPQLKGVELPVRRKTSPNEERIKPFPVQIVAKHGGGK